MKHKIMFTVICLLLFGSTIAVQSVPVTHQSSAEQAALSKTLLIGAIVNIREQDDNITANAFYLYYFTPGLIDQESGVVKGFKEVSFKKNLFTLIYSPGPFGMFFYIYGFVDEFTIIN